MLASYATFPTATIEPTRVLALTTVHTQMVSEFNDGVTTHKIEVIAD